MSARIFAPAEARIIAIWNYTLDRWGEEQADHYIRGLIDHIHSLEYRRDRWRPVSDECLRGVWFVRHERHYVFFRELSCGAVGVITVLHESMDLPSRLKEDHGLAGDD
ncbi:MAG: type II toxin-antitoxin system RelE/ParE family toxin [Verrucomicrobiota bacterium]